VEYKVREALKLALLDKALGEDKLLNKILKLAINLLALILTTLFNKLIDIRYCLTKFKKSIIVALKKPGKDDYLQLKLY
jgi:hypothetical protein